ncbi:hypothetical protein [uncultured Oscillibacter sp.]|uniref:hypothetical protein n=1 Tax=uncultured Oscillibacter sp. TaxID=876091 RepID=UPI0026345680|nr:hypothetical protein [uncultured Oscillibacter sp.]
MGKKTTGTRMEREAVKRYLQQYHAAKQKRRILEERRRTLSADLRGPSTPAYRAVPSSRPVHPDGAGAVVFQIAEVEERIAAQQAEMAKAVQNVMDLIDLLPVGSTERTVVEMRHIDCKPWEQIAKAVYMSRSAIFNYYNAALDMLARNEQSGKLLGDCKARNKGPGNGTR